MASLIAMPSKQPPSQYTGNGAAIRPSRMLCGIGRSCSVFAARAQRERAQRGCAASDGSYGATLSGDGHAGSCGRPVALR